MTRSACWSSAARARTGREAGRRGGSPVVTLSHGQGRREGRIGRKAVLAAREDVVAARRRGRDEGIRRSVVASAASEEPTLPGDEASSSGPGLFRVLVNARPLAERYFERKWWRKPLWYFLTFGFAFFAANTISLSFGAKAVNDVVASVLVVVFYEAASRVVYKAKKRTVWHWLLHYFKLGAVVGFLMDSYKLGS